jgi:hypothetical protein
MIKNSGEVGIMTEIWRDLGNRYGDQGSVLVKHQHKFFVVSSAMTPAGLQTQAFHANAHGGVTSWCEVAGGYELTVEQVIAEFADLCHCGARLSGSDHCTALGGCGCEQYERYCDAVYDPEPVEEYLSDEDLAETNDRLRAELEG